jgi:hypothetical protein
MSEVEVTSGAAPAAAAAPTNAAPSATVTPQGTPGQASAPAEQVIPAAYQPNFKYKFAGKEHEIDEAFRAAIKDEATEKKIKELYQKALGFDDAKPKWDEKVKSHYEPTVQKYQTLDKELKRIIGYRNAGDLDSFFSEVQLPYDQIKNWVIQQEELAANPQQKALYDQAFQERRARENLEMQYQEQQGQMQEVQSREREFELSLVMARPEVTEVAQKLEAMMGEGAFRQLVVDEGTRAWSLYQKDISAQDAVNLVMQRFGKLASGSLQQAVIPSATTQMPQQTAGAPAKPPIIPNINGKGTSPVKKVPKSLEEIKGIIKERI